MMNGLPITMLNGLGCGCQSMNAMPMIQTFGLGGIEFNTEPTSDWSCADWKYWHEELVKAFKEGKFASRIRYPEAEAIRLSNQVFNQWWNKLSGFFTKHQFCGYESQFFNYFKAVGLDNILSYFQAVVTPAAENAGKIVENVTDTAANTSNALRWLVPTLIGVVVVGGGFYVYTRYLKEEKPKPALSGHKRKTKKRKK